MGTADHDRVRDYIVAQLDALGIKPQMQVTTAIGTRYQEAGRVQNILAWLPGSATERQGGAARGALRRRRRRPGRRATTAPASAAMLETVRALRARKQPLAHDVIALFTDGEEAGLLGAAAFVREHPWAKDVAVVAQLRGARHERALVHVRDRSGQSRRRARAAHARRRHGRIGVHDGLSRAAERHGSVRARACSACRRSTSRSPTASSATTRRTTMSPT